MKYVHDFAQTQRSDDLLLVEILEMPTPGGKKISEKAWKAVKATVLKTTGTEPLLRDARGWYERAYEWHVVSYATHAHARLNAKAAGNILFYISSIDPPSVRMTKV